MSLLNTAQQKRCCSENNSDYTITYFDTDKTKTVNVCDKHFKASIQHDKFGKILVWQEHVKEIICLECGTNVTDSMGCQKCHPKEDK